MVAEVLNSHNPAIFWGWSRLPLPKTNSESPLKKGRAFFEGKDHLPTIHFEMRGHLFVSRVGPHEVFHTPKKRWYPSDDSLNNQYTPYLFGGFNPSEKICSSKWVHLPQIVGVKIKKMFELPPPIVI